MGWAQLGDSSVSHGMTKVIWGYSTCGRVALEDPDSVTLVSGMGMAKRPEPTGTVYQSISLTDSLRVVEIFIWQLRAPETKRPRWKLQGLLQPRHRSSRMTLAVSYWSSK